MLILTAGFKPVDHLAVGPGGRVVAGSTWSKKPGLYRIEHPEKPIRLKAGTEACTVELAFASDGALLAHWDDQLAAHDAGTGKELWRHTLAGNEYAYGHSFSPDGGRVFVTYIKNTLSDPDRQLWEVRGEKAPKLVWSRADGGDGASATSAFLAGGEVIAVGYVSNQRDGNLTVQFTEAETGQVLHMCPGRGNWAAKLTAMSDGPLAALVWMASITIYDLTSPGTSRKIVSDSRKDITAAAFHPSGRFLAASSNDGTVKLYDTTSWTLARTFAWKIGKMRSIAFSTDGTVAAAGSDSGKIVVWDVDL